jgi:signal peptidase II
MNWRVRLVLAAFLLIGCDHATKRVAKSALEGEPPRPVVGHLLDLQYTENRDAAFGIFRWIPVGPRGVMLKVIGALALGALTLALLRRRRPGGTHGWRIDLTSSALVFLLAGAAGNYGDRIFRGYVVDFIHIPHWPVFNVADAYVSIGIGLLALRELHARRRAPTV